MIIDLHTHLVPEGWEDWAARFGGTQWPRLVRKDAKRATLVLSVDLIGQGVSVEVDAADVRQY